MAVLAPASPELTHRLMAALGLVSRGRGLDQGGEESSSELVTWFLLAELGLVARVLGTLRTLHHNLLYSVVFGVTPFIVHFI